MTKHAPVRIKRVYEAPDAADGARVLVDRIWPRGLRKADAALDCWLKEIAPSPRLRQWFGHDPERFAEFARLYRAELADNPDEVTKLEDLVRQGPMTLLYAAHDETHNHAVVLAEYIRGLAPRGRGRRSA
jgi:uncharacterized protein YeaO (DUF488 family)